MKLYWISVGPNPMIGVLIRKGKCGRTQKTREEHHMEAETYGASLNQGMSTVAGNHQKLRERQEADSP